MNKILIPKSYNYIGAFLTLRCNLNCKYCLNHYGEFSHQDEMSGADWVQALNRIETRNDLPISLQGGEPTIHKDFYMIAGATRNYMDLLTNGLFDVETFMNAVTPETFNREAPYASIRFSYHETTNTEILLERASILKGAGYNVGIWGLGNTNRNDEMAVACKNWGIDFRIKEFLSETSGTYKYDGACLKQFKKPVLCKPSELLIGPTGHIYRCHSDLYEGVHPIAHILDDKIKLPEKFAKCDKFGYCNPCDVKLKTNRFQQGGHCSVTIKENE
jgi:sulfatase maturation enzyme AslB (radical SAM superfamily)